MAERATTKERLLMALSFRPLRAHARRKPPLRRHHLSIEQLEDRTTPTTFFVTSFNDSGPGTLRQAIIDSNHTPGANDIEFQIQGDIFSQGMVITNTLTIHGGGNITLFASSASVGPPLFVVQNTQVSIDGMTFFGCRSDFGGAIFNNQGSLSLSNTSFIVNDDMGGGGGAITNFAGSLTVTNSSFISNQSVDAF